MKYLTPKLKKYYMKDFNENVLTCTDNYWSVDSGLKDILININKNQNIQTLYSRKYGINNLGMDFNNSYLCFIISKDASIEKINDFIRECKSKHKEFEFKNAEPEKFNAGKWSKEVDKMRCMSDKNYFNINVIHAIIFSNNLLDHDIFWNDINKYLPNL